MRVGNIHEPQAGVDLTKIPHSGTDSNSLTPLVTTISLRFTHVDDDGRDEEAPDNTRTDDENYHFT